jgi:hypothetical protein
MVSINLGTAGDRHSVGNPIMLEPTSRNGLQYDIQSLPESGASIANGTHCLFPLSSTFIPKFIHLDGMFSDLFRDDSGLLFYGSVQVVHIMREPALGNIHEGGQYQRGKSAPEEAIQFLRPVSVSLACH